MNDATRKSALPGPKAQALIARDRDVVAHSYVRDYPFAISHGRGAEVRRVYLKDPDFDAFVWLVDQCAPDVQERVCQRIRLAFRRRPEIITRGIAANRRAVRDPATSAKERRLAQRFLEKHGVR